MTNLITYEIIKKLFPQNKNPEELTDALNRIFPNYGFTTNERIAAFLAQAGWESAQFTVFTENLNYSAAGLCKTWPTRFPTLDFARQYHRNPEKIANYVYGDRFGNGDESSCDGWKFKGRGCLQTTFKSNYEGLAEFINKDLDATVSFCETLDGAIISGIYFWIKNNLNQYADFGDFVGLTKKINGGLSHLKERQELYTKALSLLKQD